MIRTRFAPSPTGPVHIGNIRVALYNYLFARHHGGQYLLRIEDTDQKRSTPLAVEQLLTSLQILGLSGDDAPVYQSKRNNGYRAAVSQLISKDKAYKSGDGAVYLRMPQDDLSFVDILRGRLVKPFDPQTSNKDFIILRSDGSPTFHLANVVDDIFMGITHVIRGDDHIENTFRHTAIYAALDAPLPQFAHLPMIVNSDNKPYSKRDGDAYIGDFLSSGFEVGAILNYLALLSWSPGNNREIMTVAEMAATFSLDRVSRHASQFDPNKLLWVNSQHLQLLPTDAFASRAKDVLIHHGFRLGKIQPQHLDWLLVTMQSRLKKVTDLPDAVRFVFNDDFRIDEIATPEQKVLLRALLNGYSQIKDFTPQATEQTLRDCAKSQGVKAGMLIHPVRMAVSGAAGGPPLFDLLTAIGQQRVIIRIKNYIEM